MASDDERTPTEQRQPISGVATLKEIAVALRIVSDGLFAGAEVHRGRSEPERDLFLRLSADRLRHLRNLVAEGESILLSLTGHRSGEIEVARKGSYLMSNARKIVAAVGASCVATAALAQFVAHYPTVAMWTLIAGTFLGGLAINLPADKGTP